MTLASPTESTARPSKALNVGLWLAQALLALGFGMGGFFKLTFPIEELTKQMVWPGAVPPGLVRFIGASELAGAIGVILPALTRIRPVLTPLAAIGLLVIMLLAAIFHVTRNELGALPTNIVLGGLAGFIAWGRLKKAPIAPRA
jgi:uncharacterized membrane protein YphA (DoxX/SURF4 family)